MRAEDLKKMTQQAIVNKLSTPEGEIKFKGILERATEKANKGEFYYQTTVLSRVCKEISLKFEALGYEVDSYFLDGDREVKALTISWQ